MPVVSQSVSPLLWSSVLPLSVDTTAIFSKFSKLLPPRQTFSNIWHKSCKSTPGLFWKIAPTSQKRWCNGFPLCFTENRFLEFVITPLTIKLFGHNRHVSSNKMSNVTLAALLNNRDSSFSVVWKWCWGGVTSLSSDHQNISVYN